MRKEEPKTGRKDDAKQFFYLGAKVNLEGKIYTVSLSVIEYERGKFVYNLLEDPIGQLEGKLDALKKAVPVNPPSVSISTLDQRTALYDSSVDDDQTIFNIQILESVKNLEDSPVILEGRQNKVKTVKGTRLDTNLAKTLAYLENLNQSVLKMPWYLQIRYSVSNTLQIAMFDSANHEDTSVRAIDNCS